MAVGLNNQPIPRAVLEALPWLELVERLTAFAQYRLRGSIEDSKELAMETVTVFLDPESTVVWDYATEPDARRCLGSILNGLIRNFVRKRSNLERPTKDKDLEVLGAETTPSNTTAESIEDRDLFDRVLNQVANLSADDPVALGLLPLIRRGVLEVDEQAAELKTSKATVYEARRRIRDRIPLARKALGEE